MDLSTDAAEYRRKIEEIYKRSNDPDIDFMMIGLNDNVWKELELAGIVKIKRKVTDTITFNPDSIGK